MYTARLTRITVLSRRKPGMSEEAYHKYWTERHGPLVAPWLKRYGILKYTQFHLTSADKASLRANSGEGEWPVADFDGIADFYVQKYEDFKNAFEDPDYREKIRPDEISFVDMSSIVMTIGYEYVVVEAEDFESRQKPQK